MWTVTFKTWGKWMCWCIKKGIDFSPSTTTATQKGHVPSPKVCEPWGRAPLLPWPNGHQDLPCTTYLRAVLFSCSLASVTYPKLLLCTRPSFLKQVHKMLFHSLQKLHESMLHTQIIFGGWGSVQKYGSLTWLQVGSETVQDHTPSLWKSKNTGCAFENSWWTLVCHPKHCGVSTSTCVTYRRNSITWHK